MRLILSISRIAAALAVLLPMTTFAEDYSYRFVDLALFPQVEVDTGADEIDGDGFQLRGSLPVNETFFVLTELQLLGLDSVDVTRLAIGGGGHWSINGNVDAVARAGLVHYQVDSGAYDDDDTGIFLGARLRAIVAPRLELEGGFEFQDSDVGGVDNDTFLVAEARYNFTPEFSGGVIFNLGGDTTMFGLQGRYSF